MLVFIGKLVSGFFKLIRTIVLVSFIFCLAIFALTIFMPESVQNALEIFKKLLQIT